VQGAACCHHQQQQHLHVADSNAAGAGEVLADTVFGAVTLQQGHPAQLELFIS
jgi:hypothetical protein